MKRTAEEAAATRAALLDAGLVVFARDGFAAARLVEIAEAADLTRGALYHHFAGKAELLQAVMSERWEAVGASLFAPLLDREREPAERLRAFLLAYIESLASDEAFRALLTVSFSLGGLPPELAEDKQRGLREWQEELREPLEEIPAVADPESAARLLLVAVNGLTTTAVIAPALMPKTGAARRDLVERLLEGSLR